MKTLDEINRLITAIEAELVELESSRTTLLSRAAELLEDVIVSEGLADLI